MLHVTVIVEVVAAQVCKDRSINTHTIDPSLRKRMRRHLDCSVGRVLIAKLRQRRVQFNARQRSEPIAI